MLSNIRVLVKLYWYYYTPNPAEEIKHEGIHILTGLSASQLLQLIVEDITWAPCC